MLETLRIQNYALIDRLEVDFAPGFNVLTGETGAGKSIVVGALNLVLGARASSDIIRTGETTARVEALFRLEKVSARLKTLLSQQGIELEEDCLLLARTVSADGRGRAFAGGQLVPVSVLSEIGDELVDLHGQHEHQSLLRPDRQTDLVDAFAGTEADAARMAERMGALGELDREIAQLETDDRDRARRMDFLRFEVSEIDAAGLQPGEEEELRGRLRRITHAEKVHALANSAHAALYESEEGAAVDRLDAALSDVTELAEILEEFRELAGQLSEARAQIEAVADELRRHTTLAEFDPAELDELNRRQAQLGALKRKYGPDIAAILEYREKAAAELAAYEGRDARLETLRRRRAVLLAEAEKAAAELSAARRKAAAKLDRRVADALRDLDMRGARFETRFEAVPLCARGVDRIEFLLAANSGEKPKPLRQVASGGEISRIMLALKAVFAGMDRIPTLVFDEIDAGVGGAVARRVAEKMAALARSHQVLCVSHLAQIAAAAARHLTVSKADENGHTLTRVARAEGADREKELARLLDGTVSAVGMEHARALLADMQNTGVS
ncbi:MAG: DNA repair protein RecN [Candidatus Hydrogenedens sp.]|nr:DNA repair protein RecN [Candidatus Hydrogenedens sp.]